MMGCIQHEKPSKYCWSQDIFSAGHILCPALGMRAFQHWELEILALESWGSRPGIIDFQDGKSLLWESGLNSRTILGSPKESARSFCKCLKKCLRRATWRYLPICGKHIVLEGVVCFRGMSGVRDAILFSCQAAGLLLPLPYSSKNIIMKLLMEASVAK